MNVARYLASILIALGGAICVGVGLHSWWVGVGFCLVVWGLIGVIAECYRSLKHEIRLMSA